MCHASLDVLSQLWLLDQTPVWMPTGSEFTRLGQAPKHHLADTDLAAHLLGLDVSGLFGGRHVARPGRDTIRGGLFESLVTLDGTPIDAGTE